MKRPDLKDAVRLVETAGLAPLARVRAVKPKSVFGSDYSRWLARQGEVEQQVHATLAEHTARIDRSNDLSTIQFAGVRAVTTMGLEKLLENWKQKAAKRLAERGGGR